VVNDSDPVPGPTLADLQYEEARRALDVQALAWARTARRWMWLGAFAILILAAAAVGFLML
jgi:hypothetical protein